MYTEITKITSSIDAKTEPHEGRNMVSVDLSAQAQTGCVVTKGTRLCLESVGLSVLLKMNAVQFTLADLNYCFFQQYLHFERSSIFYSIYFICIYFVAMETKQT